MPRISVITPSYNQGQFLESTIRSVLAEGYPNLDYLVIDGGSTDESMAVIRHYEQHLSGWLSERDRGQADAIAKGLARADGQWFNWINSDDLLAPGALWRVASLAERSDIIGGPVQEFDARGPTRQVRCHDLDFDALLNEEIGSAPGWHQPGIWLRRDWLERAGGIDTSLHFRMDYDMLLRVLALGPRVSYVDDQALAWFRMHDSSKTGSQFQASGLGVFRDEKLRVLQALADRPSMVARQGALQGALARLRADTELQRLVADRGRSRWLRALALLRQTLADPALRLDAARLKALRRIVLHGGHRAR
jgi:glycosyltransferase involved in cell wall biosynthesis